MYTAGESGVSSREEEYKEKEYIDRREKIGEVEEMDFRLRAL